MPLHKPACGLKRALLLLMLFLGALFLPLGCSEPQAEESYLDRARSAFAAKEFLEAEKLYERYLHKNPDDEGRWEAWERLAYIAVNIRRDEGLAGDIYESMALEYQASPVRFQNVMLRLGLVYEANSLWQRAHSAWQRLLLTPELSLENELIAHLHLARIYQRSADYSNAGRHLEICLNLTLSLPSSEPSDISAAMPEEPGAEPDIEAEADQVPEEASGEADIQAVENSSSAGSGEEELENVAELPAEPLLELAMDLAAEPEVTIQALRGEALYMLAMVHAGQGETEQAEARLRELGEMPEVPAQIRVQGLFMLADLLEEQGKLRAALDLFQLIESAYPNPQAVSVRIKGLKEALGLK